LFVSYCILSSLLVDEDHESNFFSTFFLLMEDASKSVVLTEMSGRTIRIHACNVGQVRARSVDFLKVPLHRVNLVSEGVVCADDAAPVSDNQRFFALVRFELAAHLRDRTRPFAFFLNDLAIGGDAYEDVTPSRDHFLRALGLEDAVEKVEVPEEKLAGLPLCVREFVVLPHVVCEKLAFHPLMPFLLDQHYEPVKTKMADGRHAVLFLSDHQGCASWYAVFRDHEDENVEVFAVFGGQNIDDGGFLTSKKVLPQILGFFFSWVCSSFGGSLSSTPWLLGATFEFSTFIQNLC
jgi:hypothetical protein